MWPRLWDTKNFTNPRMPSRLVWPSRSLEGLIPRKNRWNCCGVRCGLWYPLSMQSAAPLLELNPLRRTGRSPALRLAMTALGVALCLSGCSEPDRVAPVDNTGESDDATGGLDAPGGLDTEDSSGGQVNGCGSDADCISILGAIPTCERAICVKSSCQLVNAADASPCDDGNPCTQATTCLGGSCMKGAPTLCDDNNPCTDDACGLPGGCTHTSNYAACGGTACEVGVCADGSCSKTPRYGATYWPGRRVRALLADGDGWIAALHVAVTSTEASAPPASNRWMRLDAAGQGFSDLPVHMTQVHAVTRAVQGDVVFAGSVAVAKDGGSSTTDAAMIRVGIDGSPRWRRTYHREAEDRLLAVVGLKDDTVAACGRTAKAGGAGEAWYVRGSAPTGFPLYDYIFGSAYDETCNALLPLAGDQLLMVGAQTPNSGNGQALAFRITENAKLVWNRSWGGKGHDEVFAAALRPGGDTWLAGSCANQPSGAPQGCLWLLNEKGDLLMTRQVLKPGLGGAVAPVAAELFAVSVQPGGGVVVAGRARESTTQPWRAFAAWRDAFANPLAARFPAAGPGFFRALSVDDNGRVALAGAVSTTDAPALFSEPSSPAVGGTAALVRMSPWGVPCVGSAPCAIKPADACDDADPCTVDWCGVICDHAPLAEGAPCGDGKTCQASICAKAP